MQAAVWCIDWDEETKRAAELVRSHSRGEQTSLENGEVSELCEPLLP
jgi:hypothetical protein